MTLLLAIGCLTDNKGTAPMVTGNGGGSARDGQGPGIANKPMSIADDGICDQSKKKGLGGACDCAPECDSGFCIDGACCNTACTGACVSCALPGQMGECGPVGAGVVDPHGICKTEPASSCGMNGLCNGAGGCTKAAPGTVCAAASCSDGALTPASTCDGNGTCVVGSPINCAPSTCQGNACKLACQSNADCVPPHSCVNGSCGTRGLGQQCGENSQCKSGFCADGVCCESACEGKCSYCALPSALGRCVLIPAGVPDPRSAALGIDPGRVCADEGAVSCASNGRCDGAGGCQRYPNGTTCRDQTCNAASNEWTAVGVCMNGACAVPEGRSCTPFTCSDNRCGSSCASDTECAAPNVCRGNSCGKQAIASLCSQDADCASGSCAQGVCCNSRCGGSCQACNLPGLAGTCSAVPAGGRDPTGNCRDQGPASCGNDGACDGAGACRRYGVGTICTPATCEAGIKSLAATCNGAGTCVPGASFACAPYTCSADGANCNSSCVGEGASVQCLPPSKCMGGKCGQAAQGQPCQDTSDCQTGLSCSGGVCCNRACGGSCESCVVTGSVGTCTAIGCIPGATQPCGMDGAQRCTTACQWGLCTGQSCSGPASQSCGNCGTQTRTCDNGVWSSWSGCASEGACAPGAMQACGTGGMQTCTTSCQWGTCGGQTCSGPGSQACGNCGTQSRTCHNGTWSDWSACGGQGVCAPTTMQACGTGGTQTCTAGCQWGNCTGQACSGPSTQACGNCGTQARTCSNGIWSDWSACSGQGVCTPAASQMCGTAGTQICTTACQWGECTGQACVGPTTQGCGNCGTQTRTCNNGVWSDWSACSGQGVCTPAASQMCGTAGTQICTTACQWGECTGQACVGPTTQGCGNCGTQTRTCNNGVWSDWSACNGQGACAPGSTQLCGVGIQICTTACVWGRCAGLPDGGLL